MFTSELNGKAIEFSQWATTDDCIYFFPLSTLVNNGFATSSQYQCQVPFESLYSLDQSERELLGIPDLYTRGMRLRAEGMLNGSDFQYSLEYLSHIPDGYLLNVEFQGNIVSYNQQHYLLSEAAYILTQKVNAFNALPESAKTTETNLRSFAEIKGYALASGCMLDSYLASENVLIPNQVKIRVKKDNDEFTIYPEIDGDSQADFPHKFEGYRRIQAIYPIDGESGRVRVVLSHTQQDNLKRIKRPKGVKATKQDIEELISKPTEFFDPDEFDLSELYSDRVIEIGAYQPKFYPFVCPYKSCWIAGANIETPENGTSRITIKNDEELSELQEAIRVAKISHNDTVTFRGVSIGLDDAEFLAEVARKQLNNPKQAVNKADTLRKVLIIEENAESTRFVVQKNSINLVDKYTLFQNPFLQEAFQLKSHQMEGVAWLQHLWMNKASGCLMADDMGLGKTLQILYFLDWHSRNYPDHKPYLVVAPVSLLENWENEYERFFKSPRMRVTRLTSRDVPRQFSRSIVDELQRMEIILTNYESLRISQLNFCAVDYDVVALDEAQKIKSPGTLVTNAAKALKGQFKIALTGTPVENTLLDLWCIMDYCVPGLLGNAKEFAAKYQSTLHRDDIDLVAMGEEIHDRLGIYFIRRLKTDAAKDLPSKIQMKQTIQMPSVQESAYLDVVNKYLTGTQSNMLITIMQIREVSEHPYLYSGTISGYDSDELESASARLQATVKFLDSIKALNEKTILFAERKAVQRMLQKVCHERYGIVPTIINGDTPTYAQCVNNGRQSRQSAIDSFQATSGFNVIIMSPVAAGMGLNVTAANHVIHYSRHWNPAKENQATDRAYRIGQTKDVFVYYPLAVSDKFKSFDMTLDELLSRKTALATSTIFPTERAEVTSEEMGSMLFGLI